MSNKLPNCKRPVITIQDAYLSKYFKNKNYENEDDNKMLGKKTQNVIQGKAVEYKKNNKEKDNYQETLIPRILRQNKNI